MKILNYVFVAIIALLATINITQCSSKNKEITSLKEENVQLQEHNMLNKENYYKLLAQYDSCRLSPAKEITKIKYINTTKHDTIYVDTTDILNSPQYYIPEPKEQVEVITTYHSDSLYKVTSGIVYKGTLLDFNQMLEFNKTPFLPTRTEFIDYTPNVKVTNANKVRFPRLFITSGLEWIDTPRLQKIDYNAGLTLLDNKNRIFQVRKSLTCTTCGSIDFGMPLIYSKR